MATFIIIRHHVTTLVTAYTKRLFSTLRELSVNRKDLLALTLVGPPRDNPELDPLAVLHLNNPLYILPSVN